MTDKFYEELKTILNSKIIVPCGLKKDVKSRIKQFLKFCSRNYFHKKKTNIAKMKKIAVFRKLQMELHKD